MSKEKEILVKMVLDMWNAKISLINDILIQIGDENLFDEVAPNRNRGIYLLGHLTAANDRLFRILEIGEPIFPHYEKLFLESPDSSFQEIPCAFELRQSWNNVNIQLNRHFRNMEPDEWFERHILVSTEDFHLQPNQNKLNIMVIWCNHISYHLGQMIMLQKKV